MTDSDHTVILPQHPLIHEVDDLAVASRPAGLAQPSIFLGLPDKNHILQLYNMIDRY